MGAAKVQDWVYRNIWNPSVKGFNPLNGEYSRDVIYGNSDLNFSQEKVSERRAHQLSLVYTCINVRAQTMACLPMNVFQEQNNNDKKSLTDHPAYWLCSQEPNNYMSAANLWLTSMIHSDSWGNSIIAIHRNGYDEPVALEIIMPDDWNVKVIDGQAWYKIRGEMYRSSDVLHFRWWSLDGLCGISPIRQNMMEIGKALKNERYGTMSLGDQPPGMLSYEGELNPQQRAENQKAWKESRIKGEVPILSARWHYENTFLNAEEAQYIQQAAMTDQRICGIWRVPPVFVQNYMRATWKNAEESDLIFAKHTITPVCTVIEKEVNMKLFTTREKKRCFAKFNMNGLLRGDITARAAFYKVMKDASALNGNEIRSLEDYNSYQGGDIFTTQGANVPVDMLREFYQSMIDGQEEPPAAEPEGKKKNGFNHSILN